MRDILVYLLLLFFGYHFGTGIGQGDWIKVFLSAVAIVGIFAYSYDARKRGDR